jgi:hypothetical protein
MQRTLDQWTTALSALLIVGALLACKKKTPPTTAPSAEPAAAATPLVVTPPAPAPAPPSVDVPGPKLGDVKRYSDKEKTQTGAARILEDGVKVFNEADDKTSDVATLDKDLLVFRLASIPDWELVEFPSGVGKVSPGWIQAKFLDAKADSKVERDAVAGQAKQAVVKAPSASAKPSTSASAKPAASTSASAKPAATTSAKPSASTTASAKPATTTAPALTSRRTKTAAPATSK